MVLRKILAALERIEEKVDLIESKTKIENAHGQPEEKSPEKWLEEGINNILGYQAGQKRGDTE